MTQVKKPVCPICYQSSDGDECRHCGKFSPHPSQWPQALDYAFIAPPTGKQLSPNWQNHFYGGLTIGFVIHLMLTLLIWLEAFEFGKKYLSACSASVQHLTFWVMVLAPALPAAIIAFLPATKGKAFSYGMLVGSGIGFMLFYLVAAMFAGWYPFNT